MMFRAPPRWARRRSPSLRPSPSLRLSLSPSLGPSPSLSLSSDAEAVAEMLQRPGDVLVITGAGISTESGIPDYRSPGRPEHKPMTHQQFMATAAARRRYWARSALGWRLVAGAEPNEGHRICHELQRRGLVNHIITQNVDGLHLRAGSPRDTVLELHGTLRSVTCQNCGTTTERQALQHRLEADNGDWLHVARTGPTEDGAKGKVWPPSKGARPDGDADVASRPDGDTDVPVGLSYADFNMPLCEHCGSDLLKPDVVFFGGSLDKAVRHASLDLVENADRLLVLGKASTLTQNASWSRLAPLALTL